MQIWDEIKLRFKRGNIITRIIYVNVAVFILVKITLTLIKITNPEFNISGLLEWIAISANIQTLPYRFWTIISYQFVHFEFLHLLFNILWLYWFGQYFLQHYSSRQALSVYLWGGILGAILYILSFNFLPFYQEQVIGSQMIGASASILALVIASAVAAPNQEIQLMFIGPVKLKYLAIAVVLIDLMSITSTNAGGHIAHLGGAFAGFLFAHEYLKHNLDITSWLAKCVDIIDNLKKNKSYKPKMKARKTYNKQTDMAFNKKKKQEQDEINRILEKIKKSGYDSLNKSEKEQLFKVSN